jgi:Cellulase (glycosyl hydrolase family 5)
VIPSDADRKRRVAERCREIQAETRARRAALEEAAQRSRELRAYALRQKRDQRASEEQKNARRKSLVDQVQATKLAELRRAELKRATLAARKRLEPKRDTRPPKPPVSRPIATTTRFKDTVKPKQKVRVEFKAKRKAPPRLAQVSREQKRPTTAVRRQSPRRTWETPRRSPAKVAQTRPKHVDARRQHPKSAPGAKRKKARREALAAEQRRSRARAGRAGKPATQNKARQAARPPKAASESRTAKRNIREPKPRSQESRARRLEKQGRAGKPKEATPEPRPTTPRSLAKRRAPALKPARTSRPESQRDVPKRKAPKKQLSNRERRLAERRRAGPRERRQATPPKQLPGLAKTPVAPRRFAPVVKQVRSQRLTARRDTVRALAAADLALPPPSDQFLSWLRTNKNAIVDHDDNVVLLRGVNVAGLDAASPAPGQLLREVLTLDDPSLALLTDLWGVNLVRVPFRAETILAETGTPAVGDLLAGLDDLVTTLSDLGLYTLLALQAPGDATGTPLPDDKTFQCWSFLADRYQDESGVLYELYAASSPMPTDWLDLANHLVGAVRRKHPASLIFLGGTSASANFSGLPLRFSTGEPVHNVVYTIRAIPDRSPILDDPDFQSFTRLFPVFASVWSDGGSDFGRSSEAAALLFNRHGIGWSAASWNANPRLVEDAATHKYAATRFGLGVRRALALPVRPQLTPYPRE